MASGLRHSRMHDASRAASPSSFSTPRSRSTPASDDNSPPSNATMTFLRTTDGRSNASRVSSLMTGVALLNRITNLLRNQHHEFFCKQMLGQKRHQYSTHIRVKHNESAVR